MGGGEQNFNLNLKSTKCPATVSFGSSAGPPTLAESALTPLLQFFTERNYSLRKNAVCDYLIQNKVLDVDNGLNQEHSFTEHLF